MRVFIAAGLTAATVLLAGTGCSTMKMPSLPKFGKSKKAADTSKLANAPPAPPFSSTVGTAPNVTMPGATAAPNYPVYPGTTYPQTPYPEAAVAATAPAPTYTAAVPNYSNATAYGSMPPSAQTATPVNPYAAYPPAANPAASPYTAPVAPGYAQQPQNPYAAPAANPYGQQPPAGYAGQAAPAYTPPSSPYAAPAAQSAANPYGTVTR